MFNNPGVNDRLGTFAFTPFGGTRKDLGDDMKAEIAKLGKAAKYSDARAD